MPGGNFVEKEKKIAEKGFFIAGIILDHLSN